jgi:NADH dehydrogenase
VPGDLLDVASYREALRACDTVVHLAAATGRAPDAEHVRVNVYGTELLLSECRRAGVANILFVSSIATTFPATADYHYARTKLQAEEAVRRSGLRFVILRPAIILGPGAPILRSLERLALLPFVLVPGSGRARVRPIHVEDVAEAIAVIVGEDKFVGETLEIGGDETVTIEELLQRVREVQKGTRGRVVHVPLWVFRAPLKLAAAVGAGGLLPITAGQLSSFMWDGLPRLAAGASRLPPPRFRLADMCVRSRNRANA